MFHNINNFSNIMDIDLKSKGLLEYKIIIHRKPKYKFLINDKNILDTSGIFYFNLDDELQISLYEKSGLGAVEIDYLNINGNEVLKKYMHLANPPTHWIENVPKWELKIPKHFFAWYQEITGHGKIF